MIPALSAVMVLGIGAAYDLRTTGPQDKWVPGWVSLLGFLLALLTPIFHLAPWLGVLL